MYHFENCPSHKRTATSCKFSDGISDVLMDESNRALPELMLWCAVQWRPFCEVFWTCNNGKAAEGCFR